jgi:DNA-binding response OmpR family regulator
MMERGTRWMRTRPASSWPVYLLVGRATLIGDAGIADPVLTAVREDARLCGVRVILLTARSRDTDVDAGLCAGADDYIIKPFSPRELLHRVNTVLARLPHAANAAFSLVTRFITFSPEEPGHTRPRTD